MFAERNGRALLSIFSAHWEMPSQPEKRAISEWVSERETPRDLFVVQQALYVFSWLNYMGATAANKTHYETAHRNHSL